MTHRPKPRAGSLLIDRFAERVRARFPGAPPGEAARIARYACARATERVGALVGVDGYLDHAVELAVVAHLRHRFTRYERLLRDGHDREDARALVQAEVIALLRRWGADPHAA
ncbi:MAG: DUF2293 domain-containing protein [Polyangiales bacterium]